jgi:hypothetical protein
MKKYFAFAFVAVMMGSLSGNAADLPDAASQSSPMASPVTAPSDSQPVSGMAQPVPGSAVPAASPEDPAGQPSVGSGTKGPNVARFFKKFQSNKQEASDGSQPGTGAERNDSPEKTQTRQ